MNDAAGLFEELISVCVRLDKAKELCKVYADELEGFITHDQLCMLAKKNTIYDLRSLASRTEDELSREAGQLHHRLKHLIFKENIDALRTEIMRLNVGE